MQYILKILSSKKTTVIAIISFLSYLYLRNQYSKLRRKKNNILYESLTSLLNKPSSTYLRRLVFTQISINDCILRHQLIDAYNNYLNSKGIKVLVNCSPIKVIKAGCQCFHDSMEQHDQEYTQYMAQTLRAQLLIQNTIQNLIQIRPQKKLIVMICDNNAMQVQLINPNQWNKMLNQNKIKQNKLKNRYDCIIHILDNNTNEKDKLIQNIWKYKKYFKIQNNNIKNNIDNTMKILIQQTNLWIQQINSIQ